ncbi:hypothetical protein EDE11_1372 [Methylomonas methanica]|uniref:Uncharacterized protein n=1 Tax=Methylomonas methanica TaxID=421 RepID=A0ABY2CG86_METMH|nr:hypothetical protein EDE11_1372 [Methylomonas methanica]
MLCYVKFLCYIVYTSHQLKYSANQQVINLAIIRKTPIQYIN